MQQKIISMLVGGIVLLTPLIPNVSWAQPTPSDPISTLVGIELTQQQETQLTQIRTQTRSQIENILTPEQRNQFKAALERREGIRSAIRVMNLSAAQKTQLQSIFQTTRSQLTSLLTPEQKRQLIQSLRAQNTSGRAARMMQILP